jgi:hypothetical protein
LSDGYKKEDLHPLFDLLIRFSQQGFPPQELVLPELKRLQQVLLLLQPVDLRGWFRPWMMFRLLLVSRQ